MAFGRIFLVSCKLGGGCGNLITDSICDEASDSERGLIFSVLGGGEGGFVGFAAGHVVACALWGVNRLTILHVEYVEKVLDVFWGREVDVSVGNFDGDTGVLRDR